MVSFIRIAMNLISLYTQKTSNRLVFIYNFICRKSWIIGAVTKLIAERPEAIYQIITAIAAIEVVTLFKNGQGAAGDLGFDPVLQYIIYQYIFTIMYRIQISLMILAR